LLEIKRSSGFVRNARRVLVKGGMKIVPHDFGQAILSFFGQVEGTNEIDSSDVSNQTPSKFTFMPSRTSSSIGRSSSSSQNLARGKSSLTHALSEMVGDGATGFTIKGEIG
jgi:hypothetical protein